MKMLEDRIRADGIVREGNVLKVDSFINHQMDIPLFREMARLPPRSARRALHRKVYTFMCDTAARRRSYAHIEYLPAQDTQPAAQ